MANLLSENIAVVDFRFDKNQIELEAMVLVSQRLSNMGASEQRHWAVMLQFAMQVVITYPSVHLIYRNAFGDALRQAGVPIGKVYTSKYNRAYETAIIAGFQDIEKTTDLTEGGLVVSPNENNRRAEAFRKMIATAPKAHTNTILITHQPNIVAALDKDWFDMKEGEASIFRPADGGYKLVARIQMEDWPHIAAAAK
jgi:hypothetical protein